MTASQRRVLISAIVAKVMKDALANDKIQVGCFERTGYLLTLDGRSGDEKIRPQQGCSKSNLPLKIPQALVVLTYDPNQVKEMVSPEEEAGFLTPDEEEINFGGSLLNLPAMWWLRNKSSRRRRKKKKKTTAPPVEEEDEEEKEEEEEEGPSLQDPEEQQMLDAALRKRKRKAPVRYAEVAY